MEKIKTSIKVTAAILALIFGGILYNVYPKNFRASVVKVYGDAGHGSGSVVYSDSKKSIILTNRNVCDGIPMTKKEILHIQNLQKDMMVCLFYPNGPDCLKIKKDVKDYEKTLKMIGRTVHIKFNNYKHKDVDAVITKLSNVSDLCLVETKTGNLPVMSFAKDKAGPGDKVISIGNPLDLENSQTDGYVGNMLDIDGRPYQHHTGIIFHGNSGGPVVNMRGEQVGVNTLKTKEATFSLMIPLNVIMDFLNKNINFQKVF